MLARDKFIPKLHLRQPGFTYRTCGLVTKHRESIQKFRETSDLKHIYQNELEKTSFDAAYFDSKALAKKTISDKILKARAYL